jgi:hypothetical protein
VIVSLVFGARQARLSTESSPFICARTRPRLSLPESAQLLQAFIRQASALARVDDLPVRHGVVGVAEPDAQRETPIAEVVQRDRLARDLLNAPARERSNHRPDPEGVRHGSDGVERHPRDSDLRGLEADT